MFAVLLSLGREKKTKFCQFFYILNSQGQGRRVSIVSNKTTLSTTRDIVCTDAGNFVFEVNSELD